jgi:hypothetical protein
VLLSLASTGLDLELLLNLCWFLLIGPGVYLWLRQRRQAKPVLQFSIALACLLFLLFPVISATDDLHAMRQEMEEPGPNKRALKQVVKRAAGPDFSAAPALPGSVVEVQPLVRTRGLVGAFLVPAIVSAGSTMSISRAPPAFFLA